MKALYACRAISPVEFRMTKFDQHHNILSSYTLTQEGCDCPQSHKPTCRHRKMLPTFAKAGHIDDGYFLDWDTRMWHKPIASNDEPAHSKVANTRTCRPQTTEASGSGDASPHSEPAEGPSPSPAVEEEAALPPSSEAKVEREPVPRVPAPLASPSRPNGPILPTRRRLV